VTKSVNGGELMRNFVTNERGQDLIEYTLLLAFIALVGVATFIGMGNTTSGIWSIVNNRLSSAAAS
jgi:Flp pilus assembly pilin Flp